MAANIGSNPSIDPPARSARATAASLAEEMRREWIISSKVHTWPCFMNILSAGAASARALTVMSASGAMAAVTARAVMTLVKAGGWRSGWRSFPASMTLPVS